MEKKPRPIVSAFFCQMIGYSMWLIGLIVSSYLLLFLFKERSSEPHTLSSEVVLFVATIGAMIIGDYLAEIGDVIISENREVES